MVWATLLSQFLAIAGFIVLVIGIAILLFVTPGDRKFAVTWSDFKYRGKLGGFITFVGLILLWLSVSAAT